MSNLPAPQPAIRLVHFIVTDVSMNVIRGLYNPESNEKVNVSIRSSLGFDDNNNFHFTVKFELDLTSEKNDLAIKMQAMCFFESKEEITLELRESPLLKMNAPAIGFPFVRAFVNTLTTNSGLASILIPTYSFLNYE